ncbi:16S rRNA (guanine(966)-N(2))-methyltransferase RsmD [Orbus sturtevantii]|uniref:16S rRNA (guanine(966)-N(2))-methyltransferase RsmD n=1 Tax=Orbus sturtevantii TaxID=3074109 RepID=UPI00370DC2BD
MNGFIRIIGGKWRGRKLSVLNSEGLRPTTDRVKETLFNWLMPVIAESSCLDCFSGSGSLAFEALSRGAAHALLIEKNKSTAIQLTKNKQLLQASNCHIINSDTLNWLKQTANQQFDIIFIDPPFYQQLVPHIIILIEQNNWIKPGAYIYIETEKNGLQSSHIPATWQLHREKITGQVQSYLFISEQV